MAHGTAVARVSAVIAVALTVAGCGAVAHNSAPSAAQLRTDLKGSPPLLAALHRQGNQLLGGGKPAFEARLHALRGYPVVVTQWSSTCEPCQVEFPYFQQLSAQLGNRVAFIGVDASDDSSGGAKSWLRRFPVSFPSYRDADMGIALALSVPFANDTPVTYLFTRTGTEWFHVGYYTSEHNLRQEIRADLGV
jgi:thiol-disulfide isomerase/thioredoxin